MFQGAEDQCVEVCLWGPGCKRANWWWGDVKIRPGKKMMGTDGAMGVRRMVVGGVDARMGGMEWRYCSMTAQIKWTVSQPNANAHAALALKPGLPAET